MTGVPSEPSTIYRLAEKALGRAPGEWINERRAAGLTWREIAAEFEGLMGVESFVSYEGVRNWHTAWVEQQFVERLAAEVDEVAS